MKSTVKTILMATGLAGAVLLGGTAAVFISKYCKDRKHCIDLCGNEEESEIETNSMFQENSRSGGDLQ